MKSTPIDEITETGVRVGDRTYEVDTIVLATGFDAMTGPLMAMDIRGRGGLPLAEKWEHGPKTYLGIMVNEFPNLFLITGPQSPSVLYNMPPQSRTTSTSRPTRSITWTAATSTSSSPPRRPKAIGVP